MVNQKEEIDIRNSEVTLAHYVGILIKRKFLLILPFLISIIVAFILYVKAPVVFEEKAVIKIGSFSKPLMTIPYAIWTIRDQKTLTDAINLYKLGVDINELKSMFDSNAITITSLDQQFLVITVEADNPEKAKSVIKSLASVFVDRGNRIFLKKKQFLEAQLKSCQDSKFFYNNPFVYQSTLNNMLSINEELLNAEEFEITESPSSDENPAPSKKSTRVGFILVLGLLAGVTLVSCQEFWVNNFGRHD